MRRSESWRISFQCASQPIRYPVEEKGRFEPLERGQYLDRILVDKEYVDVSDYGAGPQD